MEVVNNSIKEENQDIKHNTKLLLILKAISILFSICLSIAGIIIISKDDDANHGCNDIWQLTVLSVVSTLLTLSNNCVSYKKKHI